MTYALEGSKWASTSITWSFANFNYSTDVSAGNPFSTSITDATEQAVVVAAFAKWQSVSGVQFTEVADTSSPASAADIRVGFGNLQGGGEIGQTSYSYSIQGSAETMLPDVIVRLEDPSVDALVNTAGVLTYQGSVTSLYQVILHEIGHALGLAHDTTDTAAIMYPVAQSTNKDLDADDIAGVQALYGAPPSNTVLTLTGDHTQYIISPQLDGSTVVTDTVSGRDGTTQSSTITTIKFSDGTAVVDPTGVAEDVDRLYQAAFNRAADLAGVQYWTNAIHTGAATLAGVAVDFTQSAEFMAGDGMLSNQGYVQALYQNVLGRAGDPAGVINWNNTLNNGTSRGQVLAGFASSFENLERTLPNAGDTDAAEATRLYQAAFNRAPDAGGEQYWTQALQNGSTPLQVAQGFTGSAEFAAAFGSLSTPAFVAALYQNVLHRAGDAAGTQYWQNQLNSGTSSAQVLIGFADSNENRIATATTTHDGWAFLG